ncbi:hypothetical protein X726_06350 [Mesorhizobium sp. L103C105A0]|nr:hypothetical protein X726_06350 [Mesorhizobium sp. L103C105A0]
MKMPPGLAEVQDIIQIGQRLVGEERYPCRDLIFER